MQASATRYGSSSSLGSWSPGSWTPSPGSWSPGSWTPSPGTGQLTTYSPQQYGPVTQQWTPTPTWTPNQQANLPKFNDFPSLLHACACLSKPSALISCCMLSTRYCCSEATSIRNHCTMEGMSTLCMRECIHTLLSKRPARPLSALGAEGRSRMLVSPL